MLQTWYIISISIVILLHCIAWATLLLCLHSVWWGGWEKILTASNSIRSIITVLSTAETYQLIRVDTLLITFIYMFFKSKKKSKVVFPDFSHQHLGWWSTPWVIFEGKPYEDKFCWWFQPIWKIWVKMGFFPKYNENQTYLKPPPRVAMIGKVQPKQRIRSCHLPCRL